MSAKVTSCHLLPIDEFSVMKSTWQLKLQGTNRALGVNATMRRLLSLTLVLMAILCPSLHGQDAKADLQKRLSSEFVITKTTAQRDDIVTPGSVLTLHKDGLVMFSVDTKVPPTISYKDGKLSMGFGDALATNLALGSGANVSTVPQRKFVSGEKFWLVSSLVTDKQVILQVFSDAYGDTRYYGQIKFPFQKHTVPSPDELMKTISEVVTAEPPDTANSVASQDPGAPPAAAPPKTIALGQTKDDVSAALGTPQKVVNLGAKEIYLYPDMKVTFINGKVADVQ